MKKVAVCFLCVALFTWTLSGCGGGANEKPVIYLYPEEEMEVTVKLDFDGTLTSTYPAYEDGWTVTAQPDGTLTDESGREYYCLFWEGVTPLFLPSSTGDPLDVAAYVLGMLTYWLLWGRRTAPAVTRRADKTADGI